MAVSGERIFDCTDCGRKWQDAPKGSINYFYRVRINGNIHWLNRCRDCWRKHKGLDPIE